MVSPLDPVPEALVHETLFKVHRALKQVCLAMPHLSGVAAEIRLHVDRRVGTAAVTRSGRVLVNPEFFAELEKASDPQRPYTGATFVLAHELMHLCLRTHDRRGDSDHEAFNYAHDYLINDLLANELGCAIPAGGLAWPGARFLSAEKLMDLIRKGQLPGPQTRAAPSPMTRALVEAGILPQSAIAVPGSHDLLGDEIERQWFPDDDPRETERRRERLRQAAGRAQSLDQLRGRLRKFHKEAGKDGQADQASAEATAQALRTSYRPPWEMALQQWLEAVAPGPRTFTRPSRRGGDRTDVVLPGRKREGWTLHIVLDTSGSMVSDLPRLLGVIAAFAEAVNVAKAHLLQCDVSVTKDDWVTPEELFNYEIAGMGGSDMSPALRRLAEDPEVEAAVVLTDGEIEYPRTAMPYEVLWVVQNDDQARRFRSPYGRVIALPPTA